MENLIKAITIGAAIVIMLAIITIITIVFMVLRSEQQITQTTVSKAGNLNSQIEVIEFTKFDGTMILGSDVVNTSLQRLLIKVGLLQG